MERLAEIETDEIPTYLYRDRANRLWLVWDDDEASSVTQEKLAAFMMEHRLCFKDLGFDSVFKLTACTSESPDEAWNYPSDRFGARMASSLLN